MTIDMTKTIVPGMVQAAVERQATVTQSNGWPVNLLEFHNIKTQKELLK